MEHCTYNWSNCKTDETSLTDFADVTSYSGKLSKNKDKSLKYFFKIHNKIDTSKGNENIWPNQEMIVYFLMTKYDSCLKLKWK